MVTKAANEIRRITIAARALAVCAALLFWPGEAVSSGPGPYGLVTHDLDEPRARKVSEIGAGFARVSFRWWQIEPVRGQFLWHTTDHYVREQAAPRGIQLYVTLEGPPEWAGGGPGRNGHPADPYDWYNFVHAVVTRYKGHVKHWGLWNEPNLTKFLKDRNRYAEIVQWGRRAVKDADPDSFVLGPEISEHALDDGWFEAVMKSFGFEAFDIVTVHVYTGNLARRMDNQVLPWRFNKEVWLTEVGFPAFPGVPESEAAQRSFYQMALEAFESRRWWWTKIFFYDLWNWDDDYRFGICTSDWANNDAFEFYRGWIAARQGSAVDSTSDGMPDVWESQFGLPGNPNPGDVDVAASFCCRTGRRSRTSTVFKLSCPICSIPKPVLC
jgi:hypothetical protein